MIVNRINKKRSRNCSFFFGSGDGFILLEILIAFGILSLVIMGAIGLYTISLKEVREINLRALAFNRLIAFEELKGVGPDCEELVNECGAIFPRGECEKKEVDGKFKVCWKEVCVTL